MDLNYLRYIILANYSKIIEIMEKEFYETYKEMNLDRTASGIGIRKGVRSLANVIQQILDKNKQNPPAF